MDAPEIGRKLTLTLKDGSKMEIVEKLRTGVIDEEGEVIGESADVLTVTIPKTVTVFVGAEEMEREVNDNRKSRAQIMYPKAVAFFQSIVDQLKDFGENYSEDDKYPWKSLWRGGPPKLGDDDYGV